MLAASAISSHETGCVIGGIAWIVVISACLIRSLWHDPHSSRACVWSLASVLLACLAVSLTFFARGLESFGRPAVVILCGASVVCALGVALAVVGLRRHRSAAAPGRRRAITAIVVGVALLAAVAVGSAGGHIKTFLTTAPPVATAPPPPASTPKPAFNIYSGYCCLLQDVLAGGPHLRCRPDGK